MSDESRLAAIRRQVADYTRYRRHHADDARGGALMAYLRDVPDLLNLVSEQAAVIQQLHQHIEALIVLWRDEIREDATEAKRLHAETDDWEWEQAMHARIARQERCTDELAALLPASPAPRPQTSEEPT